MKLLRLVLDNFRGVPDGEYSFAHPQTGEPLDLALITGASGSGKTRLLEAILAVKETVGPYGVRPDRALLVRRSAATGRVEATWRLSEEEVRRAGLRQATWVTSMDIGPRAGPVSCDPKLSKLFAQYLHEPGNGKFEYFPANRRLESPRGSAFVPPLSEKAEARLRVGSDPGKYACLRPWLVGLAMRDMTRVAERVADRGVVLRHELDDSLRPLRAAIASMMPHLALRGVRPIGDGPAIMFERADGAELELDELSDSERHAVLFAATFERIRLHRSVVLIDSPDLHFHPNDHVRVLRALAALGEDNQLVVATTSAPILASAAHHQVAVLAAGATTPR